jgi:hypothetical protein
MTRIVTHDAAALGATMKGASRETVTAWISAGISAVTAASLFVVGVLLAFTDRTASASAAWGFGFLLVVLLLLSKFKRFKGFGVEMELWEEKQAEAAALVDQLRGLSKVIGKQMGAMAARMGLYGSALSLAQLADLFEALRGQFTVVGIPDHEIEETLQSLCERIEQVYLVVAHGTVSEAFRIEREALAQAGDPSMNPQLNEEGKALSTLPEISISALEEFVRRSEIIKAKPQILQDLAEIDRDIEHFKRHRSFRRREWLPTGWHQYR